MSKSFLHFHFVELLYTRPLFWWRLVAVVLVFVEQLGDFLDEAEFDGVDFFDFAHLLLEFKLSDEQILEVIPHNEEQSAHLLDYVVIVD